MRFGLFGSLVQIEPGNEGSVPWRTGLLDVRCEGWRLEIQPTDQLRSLFVALPELEAPYPVLVQFVMIGRG
jgi:hypothetical protein